MDIEPAEQDEVVLELLEGCGGAARREASALGRVVEVGATELRLRLPARDLARVRELRTVVAGYLCLTVPARRPRELLESSVMRDLATSIERIAHLKPRRERFTGLRIGAAGRDSADMRRLAVELGEAVGLAPADDGDLLIRLRRAPAGAAGWEVLLRLTPRPLATRRWRVVDYPGAVNATIAASVLDLMDVRKQDELLDMTCGSGTFLIEQLHRAAPARAVGVDLREDAITAAQQHQRAARRKGRVEWRIGDVLTTPLQGGFTRIITNPPWGTLHGEHATNEELLHALLGRADELAAPGARLGVLSHEIRRMHAVLAAQDAWTCVAEHRFFQKGHHPRLFLLERAASA